MATEKRLVDIQPFEKLVENHRTTYMHKDDVLAALSRIPTVDAVEVVRCKDCKHWLKDVAGCTDSVGRCEWANYMIGAVGYCVYGERRTEC